jgi:hypothetical protein
MRGSGSIEARLFSQLALSKILCRVVRRILSDIEADLRPVKLSLARKLERQHKTSGFLSDLTWPGASNNEALEATGHCFQPMSGKEGAIRAFSPCRSQPWNRVDASPDRSAMPGAIARVQASVIHAISLSRLTRPASTTERANVVTVCPP